MTSRRRQPVSPPGRRKSRSTIIIDSNNAANITTMTTTKHSLVGSTRMQQHRILLHWDDIPPWMQIDPYIHRGYRRQLDSLSACFWSLFYPHNEFVNTWSHLLPALFYLSAPAGVEWWDLSFRIGETEKRGVVRQEDEVMVQIYAVGTVICLLAPAIFHINSAHSKAVAQKLLKLDYVGICSSICVTDISSTHFGLHDKPWWRNFYNIVFILCAVALLVLVMGPNIDGPAAALFRVTAFLSLMLSGFAPIVHMYLLHGFEGILHFPLLHIACMSLCYFVGTAFYLSQWPERRWPGTFDIWGASHQLFHILVAIGQFVFFLGLRKALVTPYKTVDFNNND